MNDLTPKYETVMVIDDNNTDLYISSRIIRKYLFGKKVIQYTSARDALLYLREHQHDSAALPQIIFVDIHMPVMSGFEFMDDFDELPTSFKNKCKVYMVSSSLDEQDSDRAEKNKNITAFHEKPITKELLETIGAVLLVIN